MTTTVYDDAVQAGAAWLDGNHPDWVQVFAADLAAGLHMDQCDSCVLGYVLGDYCAEGSPIYRLGALPPSYLIGNPSPDEVARNFQLIQEAGASLGFCLPAGPGDSDDAEWALLGRAWTELIHKRLADAGMMA